MMSHLALNRHTRTVPRAVWRQYTAAQKTHWRLLCGPAACIGPDLAGHGAFEDLRRTRLLTPALHRGE